MGCEGPARSWDVTSAAKLLVDATWGPGGDLDELGTVELDADILEPKISARKEKVRVRRVG